MKWLQIGNNNSYNGSRPGSSHTVPSVLHVPPPYVQACLLSNNIQRHLSCTDLWVGIEHSWTIGHVHNCLKAHCSATRPLNMDIDWRGTGRWVLVAVKTPIDLYTVTDDSIIPPFSNKLPLIRQTPLSWANECMWRGPANLRNFHQNLTLAFSRIDVRGSFVVRLKRWLNYLLLNSCVGTLKCF